MNGRPFPTRSLTTRTRIALSYISVPYRQTPNATWTATTTVTLHSLFPSLYKQHRQYRISCLYFSRFNSATFVKPTLPSFSYNCTSSTSHQHSLRLLAPPAVAAAPLQPNGTLHPLVLRVAGATAFYSFDLPLPSNTAKTPKTTQANFARVSQRHPRVTLPLRCPILLSCISTSSRLVTSRRSPGLARHPSSPRPAVLACLLVLFCVRKYTCGSASLVLLCYPSLSPASPATLRPALTHRLASLSFSPRPYSFLPSNNLKDKPLRYETLRINSTATCSPPNSRGRSSTNYDCFRWPNEQLNS